MVSLACSPPSEHDLPIARWTVRELAWAAAEQGLAEQIHPATIARILAEAECKPHRVRYWLRSQDPQFREKATRVLWYYERAAALYVRGIVVVCLDEKPNIQALGRPLPDIPMKPGKPLRREFEYIRHGTVNLLLAHTVATGELWEEVLPSTNSADFVAALRRLMKHLAWAERVELILDNASAHTARHTQAALDEFDGRLRFHFTPTHASWLNQAEVAIGTIHRRYIRGVPVSSRDELIDRVHAGVNDHNNHFAQPLNWSYTRHAMQKWYDEKLSPN